MLVPLVREETLEPRHGRRFRRASTRVEGRDALKIVYRSTSGLLGHQETSWTDPPDPRRAERRAAGSATGTLRLYYDGSKLHMVAFEENGAVYWVSNTLLDDSRNETMIAIAKGLKPLSAAK